VTISVEKRGPVTTIVIDRPEVRNAIDREHAVALADAVRDFDADPDAHVAVLWGAGGSFCAGADLKAIAGGDGNRVAPFGDAPMGPSRIRTRKPTIAAIAGHAVAGGLELACWCDLRVVERGAVLGVYCRRWGVPLIDGGTVRLPRLIGQSHALDLILTGRAIDADEAFRIGLANRVVAPGTARAYAEQLAADLAAQPPSAMRGDRTSVLEQWGLPEEIALMGELGHGHEALLTEAQEGAQSFIKRR
jgi:enoyl-CoA hydratase